MSRPASLSDLTGVILCLTSCDFSDKVKMKNGLGDLMIIKIVVILLLFVMLGLAVDWNFGSIWDFKGAMFVLVPTALLPLLIWPKRNVTVYIKFLQGEGNGRVSHFMGNVAFWFGLLGSVIGFTLTFSGDKEAVVGSATSQSLFFSMVPLLYGVLVKIFFVVLQEVENEK